MTEKRFTYTYGDEDESVLYDNKMSTFYFIADTEENIEVFCDRLNWLVDENEQLKVKVDFYKYFQKDARELAKENGQLKARIQYLERKIQRERNIHVKEHEKWENEIIIENKKIKQQRDFYYARLQKIIKIANGDFE